ncbi:hypothetical protein STRAU_0808 [Streptomyces aurantiacus JA 4570]|uniref:Uncharacterized protein n=1 Tax=Streptomyces aurantiacus JA 4570 TaxID=1286094 RepID=S4AXE0_9ACTN|nr:hypothetical protein STRAU_0808 [Streptomyces aurantiacus JA 4570]
MLCVLAPSVAIVIVGADPAGPAVADGAGRNGLALRVTVNSRAGLGAMHPGIRVGHPVIKVYRLVNRGGADLHDVRVTDPGLPGVAIRCPGGGDRLRMLRGLGSAHCTARTVARPGTWSGQVRASGHIPYLRAHAVARAPSGYAGIGGGLGLSEAVAVQGQRATVTYHVRNTGNRPVHGIRVSDLSLTGADIDCGGGRAVVPSLRPGRSAGCRTVVRRDPGTYISAGVAEGSDKTRTIGASGGTVPPPRLTARASRRFEIRRPVVPRKPPRRPGALEGAAGRPLPAPPPQARPLPAPAPPVEPPAAGAPLPAVPVPLPLLPGALPPPLPPPGIAAPGIGPGAAPGLGPGAAPGPGLGGAPGLGPGAAPGIGAGAAPGVGPGAAPGVGPGIGPGVVAPEAAGEAAGEAAAPAEPPPGAVGGAAVAGAAVAGAAVAGADTRGTAVAPEARRQDEGRSILGRFYRSGEGPTGLGLLAALFLVLIPGAVAAAVLGSRRG